jgi:hypothetical protein
MANTFTGIAGKILANALPVLRQRCAMAQLVNTDYKNEAAKKGATIDIEVPQNMVAEDVVPSNVSPAAGTYAADTVSIQLNNWRKSPPFHLTDADRYLIDRTKNFLPERIKSSIKALANDINISCYSKYKGVFGYTGTAGTAPFGSSMAEIINARTILNQQLCPREDRRFVMDFTAEGSALARAELANFEQTNDQNVKIEGEIGRKYGFNWFSDDHVPLHVSTPLTAGAATANGAQSVGAGSTNNGRTGTVSIAKATNAAPLVQGDIISFAGSTQTYTVLANVTLAVGNTTVAIAPALQTALAGGEVMTLRASHRVNLAFNKYAFALAMRPLEITQDDLDAGRKIMTMQDPVSKLVLRLEMITQYKQVMWEFDALWGVECVMPQLACRVAG